MTTVRVSGPYEDRRTRHRDGHTDWCITIRGRARVRVLRFASRRDALHASRTLASQALKETPR